MFCAKYGVINCLPRGGNGPVISGPALLLYRPAEALMATEPNLLHQTPSWVFTWAQVAPWPTEFTAQAIR